MVFCRNCGTNENLIINKFKREGLESLCKECSKINNKSKHNKEIYHSWYSENRDRLIKKAVENRENRRSTPKRIPLTEDQKIKNRKDSSRRYKEKRKENIILKLSDGVSNLIRGSLKRRGYTKDSKTQEILGCTYIEFKDYIESKFEAGMSWSNYGEWHIDHIIPISWSKTEKEVYELNNYKNLQPLWKFENLSKGNLKNRKEVDYKHLEKINTLYETGNFKIFSDIEEIIYSNETLKEVNEELYPKN